MSKRKFTYVALVNIEVPPGSGQTAYAQGEGVPDEAIQNLGLQELVGLPDGVPEATPPKEPVRVYAPHRPAVTPSNEESAT